MNLSEEITVYVCDAVKETPNRFINKDGSPMTPFEALASLVEPIAQLEAELEQLQKDHKFVIERENKVMIENQRLQDIIERYNQTWQDFMQTIAGVTDVSP